MKTYTEEEVLELLEKQRHLCHSNAEIKESEYVNPYSECDGRITRRIDKDSIINAYLPDFKPEEIEIEIGDIVKLPFNETGKLVKIEERIWASKYYVKMKKVNPAFDHKTNQIIEFLKKDLTKEKKI